MKRLKYALFPLVIIALLAVLPISMGNMQVKAASTTKCNGWSVSPTLNPSTLDNQLYGVTTISASDAWAVGRELINQTGNTQAFTEHWNGSSWSIVPNINPGQVFNDLGAVAAISTNNVWAVGSYTTSDYNNHTLIEQWNGTQWSEVTAPPPPGLGGGLVSLAVISASNIWAVGGYLSQNATNETLIEHWDGTQWSIITNPNPSPEGNTLYSIAAVSANDIWTVGSAVTNGNYQALVEHWDGTQWSVVPAPSPGTNFTFLRGVTALSTNNVWAVGTAYNGSPKSTTQALIEQWNGTQWNIVPGAKIKLNSELNGVVALSATNIWAVGGYHPNASTRYTLIEQWNGTQWKKVSGVNPGSVDNLLYSVVPVPQTNHLWTVGRDAASSTDITQFSPRSTINSQHVWNDWRNNSINNDTPQSFGNHKTLAEFYC
ncbi:MAG: hypothetical protein ABI406_16805 [Ktedonobacteraceae bacterium]